jgi:AraC-like DNA-binding protein
MAYRPFGSGSSLTPMKAVTELRAQIDAFAARYAAGRVAAGADPEPLLAAFDQLQTAAKSHDYAAFDAADTNLHLTIVALADVERLAEVWKQVASQMKPFHTETLRTCWPDLDVLFEAHRPMIDAICDGDASSAEAAARAHLDAVWYRLAEHTDDTSLPHDPLGRALAYLALNLDQPVRLSYLAQHVAHVSQGHLARLFRERFGVSFSDHLRELRLQSAADRLRHSRHPIGKIAGLVGYRDPSRFSQHFSRRFKITPSAYRKRFTRPDISP